MVFLATAATIIASQAVISGAFSLSSQAMQLGLLPRLNIRRTSETQAGQIYLPTINLLLMIGVILLVGIFKNSDALANAYGLAVTGTMSVTTAPGRRRGPPAVEMEPRATALLVAPLLAVDLALFGANSLKLLSGGWVPLAIGGSVVLVIVTWLRGSYIIGRKARRDRIPLADFLASLQRRPPPPRARHGGLPHLRARTDAQRAAAQPQAQRRAAREERHRQRAHRRRTAGSRGRAGPIRGAQRLLRAGDPGFRLHGEARCAGGAARLVVRRSRLRPDDHLLLPRPADHHPRPRPRPSPLQDLLFIALARNSADPSDVFAIPPAGWWRWASRSPCERIQAATRTTASPGSRPPTTDALKPSERAR